MASRYVSRMLDFSGGVIGGVSDYGRSPRHGRAIDNLLLRPFGALQIRPGSQRASSALLSDLPHTLLEWVSASGSVRLFAACEGSPAGKLFRIEAGAITAQTMPFALPTTDVGVHDQLNDAMFLAHNGGNNPPAFWRSTNPANTWHTSILPRPAFMDIADQTVVTKVSGAGTLGANTKVNGSVTRGASTLTLTVPATGTGVCVLDFGGIQVPNCRVAAGLTTVWYEAANLGVGDPFTLAAVAGGSIEVGAQPWYRLRYRYLDGSSRASKAVRLGAAIVAPNQTVAITNIVEEIRSDYVGWTLERTKLGGTADGPWYEVVDKDKGVSSYNDTFIGGDLGARTDPDLIHNEPVHYDGVIAHRERLFGWSGSKLYCSQTIGDSQATGICNWNPLNEFPFGEDDGDQITCVIRQNDRLLVFKRWSVWALEGYDPSNFVVVPIYQGAGASGPRAAASMGARVWFYGDGGMHAMVGNDVRPFGWKEVGHLFDKAAKAKAPDAVVKNYLGQLVLVAFSSGGVRNDTILVYDQRFGGWVRFTGWYPQDILVQKAGTFGDAQAIIFADTRDRDAGVGFDYRIWLGFYGLKDERAADGTGGTDVPFVVETPTIDDGSPDVVKDYERLQVFVSADQRTSLSVNIAAEPNIETRSLSFIVSQAGTVWGSGPLWGEFTWGQVRDQHPLDSIRAGLTGTQYRLRVSGSAPSDFQFKGYAMDVILLPERRLS